MMLCKIVSFTIDFTCLLDMPFLIFRSGFLSPEMYISESSPVPVSCKITNLVGKHQNHLKAFYKVLNRQFPKTLMWFFRGLSIGRLDVLVTQLRWRIHKNSCMAFQFHWLMMHGYLNWWFGYFRQSTIIVTCIFVCRQVWIVHTCVAIGRCRAEAWSHSLCWITCYILTQGEFYATFQSNSVIGEGDPLLQIFNRTLFVEFCH